MRRAGCGLPGTVDVRCPPKFAVWLSYPHVRFSPSYSSPGTPPKPSDREARLSHAAISSRFQNSEWQALSVFGLIGRRRGIGPVGHGPAG
jgi:hypothetical protein